MTHCTIGAMVVTDLICGRHNPWAKLYDPSRKTLKELPEYAKHNISVGMQYRDWVTSGEVSDIEDISPCEGAILRKGLSKIAVYRDEHGKFHACSAVCTHLGALVRWNADEKSWDCPAHGSRFDPLGKVITGPANKDLPISSIETHIEKGKQEQPLEASNLTEVEARK